MRAARHNRTHRRRGGFSLLELLIVLAIIGVIAAMVLPNLIGLQQQANIDTTKLAIASFEQTLDLYASRNLGQYPEGGTEAVNLLIQPKDRNGQPVPAYIDEHPKDAWVNPLNYEYPNTKGTSTVDKPAIWSNGPDGKDDNGSNDDLNNWVIEAP